MTYHIHAIPRYTSILQKRFLIYKLKIRKRVQLSATFSGEKFQNDTQKKKNTEGIWSSAPRAKTIRVMFQSPCFYKVLTFQTQS